MSIKAFVRNRLRSAGWDLKRYDPHSSDAWRLVRQLGFHQIDVVLDVGANTGQFAGSLRNAGFKGRIVSFEPSTAAHAALLRQAQGDPNWVIAPRTAIGDHDGTIRLNLAGNSVSSSVLPMLPLHGKAAPESQYIGSESVVLRTLDSLSAEFVHKSERIFLKIDVQGFESKVLQGAAQFLPMVSGLQLEMSLVPLYQGELLYHPMLHQIQALGFELWSVVPGFFDPESCRLLQFDAVLFRPQ